MALHNYYADSCNGEYDVGNIRLAEPRQSTNDGAVQICNEFMWHGKNIISWNFVLNTANTWNITAAEVACKQLGLPHSCNIEYNKSSILFIDYVLQLQWSLGSLYSQGRT